jgi:hypothetical protein
MTLRTSLAVFSCVVFVAAAGCGKDLFIEAGPPPASTLGTGNWIVTGFYQSGPSIFAYSFGGSLVNNGGQISGVFHINQSCFGDGATDVPYTGMLDNTNTLTITSSPVNGQVLTFLGTLSSDGSSVSDGIFKVTGGCSGGIMSITIPEAGGATMETKAYRVPSLTGSWGSASWTPVAGGDEFPLSEELTQASAPDVHGNYALTGTVTVTGSNCFTHGTLQSGSFISGLLGREIVKMNDGSTIDAVITGSYGGQTGTRPTLLLEPGSISGGNCNGPIEVGLS